MLLAEQLLLQALLMLPQKLPFPGEGTFAAVAKDEERRTR